MNSSIRLLVLLTFSVWNLLIFNNISSANENDSYTQISENSLFEYQGETPGHEINFPPEDEYYGPQNQENDTPAGSSIEGYNVDEENDYSDMEDESTEDEYAGSSIEGYNIDEENDYSDMEERYAEDGTNYYEENGNQEYGQNISDENIEYAESAEEELYSNEEEIPDPSSGVTNVMGTTGQTSSVQRSPNGPSNVSRPTSQTSSVQRSSNRLANVSSPTSQGNLFTGDDEMFRDAPRAPNLLNPTNNDSEWIIWYREKMYDDITGKMYGTENDATYLYTDTIPLFRVWLEAIQAAFNQYKNSRSVFLSNSNSYDFDTLFDDVPGQNPNSSGTLQGFLGEINDPNSPNSLVGQVKDHIEAMYDLEDRALDARWEYDMHYFGAKKRVGDDRNGDFVLEPVLDHQGNPVVGPFGNPEMRNTCYDVFTGEPWTGPGLMPLGYLSEATEYRIARDSFKDMARAVYGWDTSRGFHHKGSIDEAYAALTAFHGVYSNTVRGGSTPGQRRIPGFVRDCQTWQHSFYAVMDQMDSPEQGDPSYDDLVNLQNLINEFGVMVDNYYDTGSATYDLDSIPYNITGINMILRFDDLRADAEAELEDIRDGRF